MRGRPCSEVCPKVFHCWLHLPAERCSSTHLATQPESCLRRLMFNHQSPTPTSISFSCPVGRAKGNPTLANHDPRPCGTAVARWSEGTSGHEASIPSCLPCPRPARSPDRSRLSRANPFHVDPLLVSGCSGLKTLHPDVLESWVQQGMNGPINSIGSGRLDEAVWLYGGQWMFPTRNQTIGNICHLLFFAEEYQAISGPPSSPHVPTQANLSRIISLAKPRRVLCKVGM
ncbi:hypothetical protein B0T25DRAFT_309082 [Lasiosphaeria hispida]|uniref:Uncharacterized protein n=1 Tax=Lasiosphaeria hispida TaxID=260671 RepID=A0AAJ0M9F7_9PEZI|nr:hypothetical protein B0T25DRAFT_309082 [Lasiosphaeria hispida]